MNTALEILSQAEAQIKEIIGNSTANSRTVIGRYTAAAAINFTDWISKTLLWVRHPIARYALSENLQVESVDDHVGMLYNFAASCNAWPREQDSRYIYPELVAVRALFADPLTAGLSGATIIALVERGSLSFMLDLAWRGKECGCGDFTYTDVHSMVDLGHSAEAAEAAEKERGMGYQNPELIMERATEAVVSLVRKIWS